MFKRILIVSLGLLAAAFVAYALWPAGQEENQIVSGQTAPPSDGGDAPEAPADEAGPDDEPQQLARRARQLGESRRSELRELAVSQHRLPHDVPMEDYKAALWSDIKLNPPRLETRGDPELDAEAAYTQYMYFGMCSMAPRTGRQADRRLEQLAERAERTRGRYLRGIENRVNQTIDMYELCSRIPPDVDPRREAILWMSEAVRLGHEIAQVQYYEKVKGFLLRPDPYTNDAPLALQQSSLIGEFKATARMALNGALEKGHPEAYLAMSRALFEGVLYSRDPVMAFAYARAAELEAMSNHIILRGLDDQKSAVSQYLDNGQLAEAEGLVQQLRRGPGG
jgi:hypothetical protein